MIKAEALTQDFIHGQLDASLDAVEAALCAIYDRQRAEEALGLGLISSNSVGFSRYDREFCSSLVLQIKGGRRLTFRQCEFARRKLKVNYWRQLITLMTTELPDAMVDVSSAPRSAPNAPVVLSERTRAAISASGSW